AAMATAKASSNWWPSMALAAEDPIQAAAEPTAAKRIAQGQRTRPALAWPPRAPQLVAVDGLGRRGPYPGRRRADRGEEDRAGPAHPPRPGLAAQGGQGVERYARRRGADGHVRVAHADDIEEQRHGQNGAAAAE